MQMTVADVAYMKGEAAVQPGDNVANAPAHAAEYGYLVPGEQRNAFMEDRYEPHCFASGCAKCPAIGGVFW